MNPIRNNVLIIEGKDSEIMQVLPAISLFRHNGEKKELFDSWTTGNVKKSQLW